MVIQPKRILTGIKPTSDQFHIGNYFGVVKPLIDLSQQFRDAEIYCFIAIMHALTTLHDGSLIRQNAMNMLKLYIAAGLDPKRFVIYNPALISAHSEVTRAFSCITHMGFMERMHAYKDALQKGKAGDTSVGTFLYPILMAVDILLYDADMVPVGQDQKQHVEYARDIAQKFNHIFGETFVLPDVYIKTDVATVSGIDGRKMSKSYNNYIGLLDDEKTVLKKIKQIPTDAKSVDEPKDPDVCNVYNMLRLFLSEAENETIRDQYTAGGMSYKYIKDVLFEKIQLFLQPIQQKYASISDQDIIAMLAKNHAIVHPIAEKKKQEVYQKVGFIL